MTDSADENLYAAARDIARALGKDPSAAGDILQILSGYGAAGPRSGDSRATPPRGANVNVDRALNSLERQISSYIAEEQPIWSDPVDSRVFLDAIDELIAMAGDLRSMAGDKSVAVCRSRADELIQQVMFRLQEELGFVMDRVTESIDSDEDDFSDEEDDDRNYQHQVIVARPISDFKIVIEALKSSVIGDLNAIALRMVSGGFGKECSRVYSSRRREFLEESLSRLRLKGLTMEEVQETPWRDLEDEIDRWIKAITMVFRVFFPSERLLCDRVFSDLPSSVTDLSFMEVCRGTTTQLLNFADAIALGSRLPERLFKVMDLYEAIQDLIPKIETLFSNQYCSSLKHEAIAIQKRLGEAIRGIFMELENLIRRDPPKSAFPSGGIHPITRYVMNYLRAACKSRQSLEQILEETRNETGSDSKPLSVEIRWVLELLETNLEGKSRTYRDPALCFIFMMNNGKYILDKVTDNEIGLILGEDWIVKHSAKLRQYHSNYRRSCWNQVVGLLRIDVSYPKLMENLKVFKSRFDEICKIQSQWVVADEQLREELRSSVAGIVSPAYLKFVEKLKESPESGRRGEPFIAYSVEDLEFRIKTLFKESSS